MSTRAIFAKALTDGTYVGGWQWNDGGSYTASELNKKLSNEEDVDKLIALGQWNTMYSKKELTDFIEWYNRDIGNFDKNKIVTEIGKYHVLQDANVNHRTLPHELNYNDMEEMLGQDINYVYIYYPENNGWKKHIA